MGGRWKKKKKEEKTTKKSSANHISLLALFERSVMILESEKKVRTKYLLWYFQEFLSSFETRDAESWGAVYIHYYSLHSSHSLTAKRARTYSLIEKMAISERSDFVGMELKDLERED